MRVSEVLAQIERALGYVELRNRAMVAGRLKWVLIEIAVLNAKANITCEAGAEGEAATKCGRCGKSIDEEEAEVCWYCRADLCCDCWDRHGHCGHSEADAMNERARAVAQPEEAE